MSSTSKLPNKQARADLETAYLVALMRRDAMIFGERTRARDAIMALEPIKFVPEGPKKEREALNVFEDSLRVLR